MKPAAIHRPFGVLDVAVAALMVLMLGFNIIAMKVAVSATAPFTAPGVRLALVGLLCLPWIRPRGARWTTLALFGAINGGLFLLFVNMSLAAAVNVGAVAIAGQLSVPISLLLGVVFLRERITRLRLLGVVLAFAGVAMLMFDPRIVGELPAVLLMCVAATCFATGTLIQRRLAGVHPLTLYAWTGFVGAAMLLPIALWREPGRLALVPHLPLEAVLAFAFNIVGATLLGQGGLAWLLGRHPVSEITPILLAAPVVSVLASAWYFGTAITTGMIVGGLITLAGVLIVVRAAPRVAPPAEGQ